MTELERNLDEVTDEALKTGEKIVTMQCPCCGRTYYATESEASYQYNNPASQAPLKLKHLGRKCPFCGYAGGFDQGEQSQAELDRQQMMVEIQAEQMAQDAADKRKTPWSVVNNMGIQFVDPKDDE